MSEQTVSIRYPKRRGFIMVAYDLRSVFRSVFNLHTIASEHDRDVLQISLNDETVYQSEHPDPDSIDTYAIASRLSEVVLPVRPFKREDFAGGRLKESEIESEWKHCLCSGE